MDNNIVRFLLRQLAAASFGAISTAIVFGGLLTFQNYVLGGARSGLLFLFLAWGVSWTWWANELANHDILAPNLDSFVGVRDADHS